MGIYLDPSEQVNGVVVCDRHQHVTGQGHINPTGKGHTTGGTAGGVLPQIDNKKFAVVHKDYVLDYTKPLKNILMEMESGDGGLTYRYVYGLDKVGTVIYGIPNGAGSQMQYIYKEAGETVIVTKDPGAKPEKQQVVKLYYHQDHLGTTDYLTDNIVGKVTSYVTYDDWGFLTAKAVLKIGVRELDLVNDYTGHPYDMVLGVYYAKARIYDADTRRFMAVDPDKGDIRNPQTMAQYTYCLNNPIIYIDPFGKETLLPLSIAPSYDESRKGVHFDSKYFVVVNSRLYVEYSDYVKYYSDITENGNASMTISIGKGENRIDILFEDYKSLYPTDGVYATIDDNGKITKVDLLTPKVVKYTSMFIPILWRTAYIADDPTDAQNLRFLLVKDSSDSLKLLVDFEYFNQIVCMSIGETCRPIKRDDEWFRKENLIWPTKSRKITSEYGYREYYDNDGNLVKSNHSGIDIGSGNEPDKTIYAVASGVVLTSGWQGAYGWCVDIRHDDKYATKYGHMVEGSLTVSRGQVVLRQTPIGTMGKSGRSTGVHLHFEVRIDGVGAVDPLGTPRYLP